MSISRIVRDCVVVVLVEVIVLGTRLKWERSADSVSR